MQDFQYSPPPHMGSIGDEYDSTASYAVGNLCIHENRLYRCNTAIASGGETWNAAHWTETSLAEEIEGANSNFIGLNGTKLTGTTNASVDYPIFVNYPSGYNNSNTIVERAEAYIVDNWSDIYNGEVGIQVALFSYGIGIYTRLSEMADKPFRLFIRKYAE